MIPLKLVGRTSSKPVWITSRLPTMRSESANWPLLRVNESLGLMQPLKTAGETPIVDDGILPCAG